MAMTLIDAVKAGDLPRVQQCLIRNMDVNMHDVEYKTPLVWAIAMKNLEMVELLVDNGASLRFCPLFPMRQAFQSYFASLNKVLALFDDSPLWEILSIINARNPSVPLPAIFKDLTVHLDILVRLNDLELAIPLPHEEFYHSAVKVVNEIHQSIRTLKACAQSMRRLPPELIEEIMSRTKPCHLMIRHSQRELIYEYGELLMSLRNKSVHLKFLKDNSLLASHSIPTKALVTKMRHLDRLLESRPTLGQETVFLALIQMNGALLECAPKSLKADSSFYWKIRGMTRCDIQDDVRQKYLSSWRYQELGKTSIALAVFMGGMMLLNSAAATTEPVSEHLLIGILATVMGGMFVLSKMSSYSRGFIEAWHHSAREITEPQAALGART